MERTDTVQPNYWGVVGMSRQEAQAECNKLVASEYPAYVFGPNQCGGYNIWIGTNLLLCPEQVDWELTHGPDWRNRA